MQNYTNISVTVNGSSFYATQASFSVTSPQEPVYALGNVGKVAQDPNGPVKGTFSIDYHVGSSDPVITIFNNIVAGIGSIIAPIGVALGGQTFGNAYLTSHGANGSANQLITAKASFDLYFTNTDEAVAFGSAAGGGLTSNTNVSLGHGANTQITQSAITNATSFQYESSLQYDYVYKLGTILPQAVYFSRGSRKMTVEGYEVSANVKMCADTATASVAVNGLCPNGGGPTYAISSNGLITAAEGSVSAGQVGRGKVTITQFI